MDQAQKRVTTEGISPRPNWIRSKLLPVHDNHKFLQKELKEKGLYTVCQEAKCPNIGECWENKTATMMILGDTCTRACRFCHVKTGNPKGRIDLKEVDNASLMVEKMNLNYIVITSVDRDDLPDYGAGHFANIVARIRRDHPSTKVEVLIPDFNLNENAMKILAMSDPFVIAQNLETVESLTTKVRDKRAGYQKTLDALSYYKTNFPHIYTKSSLMVGLGETETELDTAMKDLKDHHVDILTIGQYLRPSKRHLAVEKYYHPSQFESLKSKALKMGFKFVASGPMVRSSYKAKDFFEFLRNSGHHV